MRPDTFAAVVLLLGRPLYLPFTAVEKRRETTDLRSENNEHVDPPSDASFDEFILCRKFVPLIFSEMSMGIKAESLHVWLLNGAQKSGLFKSLQNKTKTMTAY